jgi:hypothetical protein
VAPLGGSAGRHVDGASWSMWSIMMLQWSIKDAPSIDYFDAPDAPVMLQMLQ